MECERILVVDDDPIMHSICARVLGEEGYQLSSAMGGVECLSKLKQEVFDIVLLDFKMPDLDGIEVLRRIREGEDADMAVVIVTGKATVKSAIEALRLGAQDYLTKPFRSAELLSVVQRGLEVTKLKRQMRHLAREGRQRFKLEGIIGNSPEMQRICETVIRVAASPLSSVLIQGETGTGKRLIAQAIHLNSARAGKPFVQVNCTAIPENLVEIELFGHEKGAFTDARETKIGQVEQAHQGTLFLDEIGHMPLNLQPKLLNVIEERRFKRIGGTQEITVDVRIIAATNRDLEQAINDGEFRPDLYYRLNVIPIRLPPLRERKEDIPLLARHFAAHYAKQFGKQVTDINPEAEQLLTNYNWPGNVRELRNAMERAVLLCKERVITKEDLFPLGSSPDSQDSSLAAVEKSHILSVLRQCNGNKTHAAQILGVSVETLRRRLREWGLEYPSDTTICDSHRYNL